MKLRTCLASVLLISLAGCAVPTPPPAPAPVIQQIPSKDYQDAVALQSGWRGQSFEAELLSRETVDSNGNRLLSFHKLSLSLQEPLPPYQPAVEALMSYAARAQQPMVLQLSAKTADQQKLLVEWIKKAAARGGSNAVKLDVVRGPNYPLQVSVQYQP